MLSKDTKERIKFIEIYTRKLLGGTRAGDHVTRQKGFGLDFDQIREYQQGDDVRYIDWKSSARSGKVLVKQYYQEHARTIMLAVDCSTSLAFGSGKDTKYQCLATIASILALVAHENKDSVSLVLFADDIELYIPPRTGYGHVQAIMKLLFEREPKKPQSNFARMLRFVGSKKTSDSVLFLLSDFIGLDEDALLRALARTSELVAVRCLDAVERSLPSVGLLCMQDIETGEYIELDAKSSALKEIHKLSQERIDLQNTAFARCGIDVFDAVPNTDHVAQLIRFFRRRGN